MRILTVQLQCSISLAIRQLLLLAYLLTYFSNEEFKGQVAPSIAKAQNAVVDEYT